MNTKELDTLVERLSEPWRREGFKPADMELAADAIKSLSHQLAECERERDAIKFSQTAFDEVVRIGKDLTEELATVMKEQDELKAYWFDDADPAETKYANEYALAKLGADKGEK